VNHPGLTLQCELPLRRRSVLGRKALLVGNSDGIGLAVTGRLLDAGWRVTGISRSGSRINDPGYKHFIADVCDRRYRELLDEVIPEYLPELCIYFAGIGELIDPSDMSTESEVIDVNFTGMIRTAAGVVPMMVGRGHGHFMGVSSLADELLSAQAPSYHASKAGVSNYLGGLALALKPRGVYVTNIRFGFVDTKMAKGDFKPFMMTVEKAVDHIEYCIRRKPTRHTAPKAAVPFVKFRKFMMKLGAT
jgi:NAD(P)-dependent dehydrogenase (short-subunit alcohol dehydrogenase family)